MLVVATGNAGKMRELQKILPSFSLVSMREAGFAGDIEENGTTFEENALIKARAVWEKTGKATIADDSGLMVDALFGAPGIYSARYAGENATDTERIQKLLSELQDVPEGKRDAAFVCALAYISPDGEETVFRGECRGVITKEPCGEQGFGYDPVFYIPAYGKTFGELDAETKNSISHRFRALMLFKEYMEKKG